MDLPRAILILKALANNERIEMLKSLCQDVKNPLSIESEFYLEQSTVSHHLTKLARLDLVSVTREGRRHMYSTQKEHVCAMLDDSLDCLLNSPPSPPKVTD